MSFYIWQDKQKGPPHQFVCSSVTILKPRTAPQMKHYKIHLATKPYLKKFLHAIYGDPLFIDPATDFGDIIITKLSSDLHCNLDKHDIDVRMNRLTDKVTMFLPIHWWYKLKCNQLSQHQVIRINRYFENVFEKEMHEVVQRAHSWMGIERQIAIECFAENHKIELDKDITFEGLKKMEYRYRQKHGGLERITQNIVTTLQLSLFA